jgi:hypothetical protein
MKRLIATLAALAGGAAPLAAADEPVTWTEHVAPLLWKNCANCHRPGEIGPFSLLTYKDAAKRADFIGEVTASRRMPPWKAEGGFGTFHDARRLSAKDVQTLAAWARAGAPEGDPARLPPVPKFPEGWHLGQPDVVLKVPRPFRVPAGGRDVFRCFVIPIPMDADRMVAAVEFRPGNPKVVHHALLFLDANGAGRAKDGTDGQPGYSSFGGPGILPTGSLGGWAPGALPRFLPEGIGKYLKKGSDLVLQIHYHPSGKEEVDQSVVGLYYTKKPARKIVTGVAVRSRRLYIPAGASNHTVTAESAPLPVDVDALSVFPHMHLLGREMKAVAVRPDGREVPLIWIKDWDFNWQGSYQYAKPVRLPQGTVIKVRAVYDNSADNPKNPNNPPKPVRWGEQTTDEMCLLGLQVTTDTRADLRKLAAMPGNRLGVLLGGGIRPQDLPGRTTPAGDVKIPAGGIPIPAQYKDALGRYDKNGDGKLSAEEIEAMPAPLRDRVKEAIRQRLGGQEGPPKKR